MLRYLGLTANEMHKPQIRCKSMLLIMYHILAASFPDVSLSRCEGGGCTKEEGKGKESEMPFRLLSPSRDPLCARPQFLVLLACQIATEIEAPEEEADILHCSKKERDMKLPNLLMKNKLPMKNFSAKSVLGMSRKRN